MLTPLLNGQNGRDTNGRFLPGNQGGPGNPYARKTAELRRMILDVVTADDILAVVRTLIERAKIGEKWAVRELFDRTIGKPLHCSSDDEAYRAGDDYRLAQEHHDTVANNPELDALMLIGKQKAVELHLAGLAEPDFQRLFASVSETRRFTEYD